LKVTSLAISAFTAASISTMSKPRMVWLCVFQSGSVENRSVMTPSSNTAAKRSSLASRKPSVSR
jgi:hypothetical protein